MSPGLFYQEKNSVARSTNPMFFVLSCLISRESGLFLADLGPYAPLQALRPRGGPPLSSATQAHPFQSRHLPTSPSPLRRSVKPSSSSKLCLHTVSTAFRLSAKNSFWMFQFLAVSRPSLDTATNRPAALSLSNCTNSSLL